MEDIKKNIFYKPSLDIERDYRTSGTIISPESSFVDSSFEETQQSLLEEAVEKSENNVNVLIRIKKILNIIPKKIRKNISDTIDILIAQSLEEQKELNKLIAQEKEEQFYEQPENKLENEEIKLEKEEIKEDSHIIKIEDKNIISNKEKDILDSTENKEESFYKESAEFASGQDDEDYFLWEDSGPTNFEIKVLKAKSIGLLAQEQYLKDSTNLKEIFANDLNYAMQKYTYPLFEAMNEIGISNPEYLNIEYEGKTVSGYGLNEQHLNDCITRNQFIEDEKSRLFNKTHNENILLGIISAFDISSQQRVRYYTEKYNKDILSYLDVINYNVLGESRKLYEARYNKAKANMYKYLNSTVILTSDILKNNLDACCAKCYLLSKDINIYAKEEFESIGYTSSSSNAENLDNTGNNVNKATNTVN
jgi:hypothetical protein